MARFQSSTHVEADTAGLEAGGLIHRFTQAADPAILQARFDALAQQLASDEDAEWTLCFLDLAGGGDGHTFVLHTVWANADQQVGVLVPTDGGTYTGSLFFRLFFYMAAQAQAISAARLQAQQAIKAFVDAAQNPLTEAVLLQTLGAGAQQGTRVMGALVAQFLEAGE